VAQVVARNLSVAPGVNSDVCVDLLWHPKDLSGADGEISGRQLLSQYVSGLSKYDTPSFSFSTNRFPGLNTTVTVQTYEGTIPALPNLGRALSTLGIDVQVPRLPLPGSPGGDNEGSGDDDDDHDAMRFIQDATVLSTPIDVISSSSQHT